MRATRNSTALLPSGTYTTVTVSRDLTDSLRLNLQAGRYAYISSVAANSNSNFANCPRSKPISARGSLSRACSQLQRGGTLNYNQWTTTLGIQVRQPGSLRGERLMRINLSPHCSLLLFCLSSRPLLGRVDHHARSGHRVMRSTRLPRISTTCRPSLHRIRHAGEARAEWPRGSNRSRQIRLPDHDERQRRRFQLNESRIESSATAQTNSRSCPCWSPTAFPRVLLVFHPYYRDSFNFEAGSR